MFPLNSRTVEFYEDRRRAPTSLYSKYERAEEVWTMWHTGSVAHLNDILSKTRITRLILMDPRADNKCLDIIADWHRRESIRKHKYSEPDYKTLRDDISNDIIRTTAEALKLDGLEVKWFSGFLANTISIVNPHTADQWIYVETLFPYIEPEARCGFVVKPKEYPDLFRRLSDLYETMWHDAENFIPSEKDCSR